LHNRNPGFAFCAIVGGPNPSRHARLRFDRSGLL
jgi:hypothetical protein